MFFFVFTIFDFKERTTMLFSSLFFSCSYSANISKFGYYEFSYCNESISLELTPPFTKVAVRIYPENQSNVRLSFLTNYGKYRNIKISNIVHGFIYNSTKSSLNFLNKGTVKIWIIEDTECTGETVFYDLQYNLDEFSMYQHRASCWFFSDSLGLSINASFMSSSLIIPYFVFADEETYQKQKCNSSKCSIKITANHSYMAIGETDEEYNMSLSLKYQKPHIQYRCNRESAMCYNAGQDVLISANVNCTDVSYNKFENDPLWKY